MQQVEIDGREHDVEAVLNRMDDEIREWLVENIVPCTDQKFVDTYIAMHAAKFNEPFVMN